MKYLDEFRDGRLAQGLAARIRREIEPERRYALMEFCGGHTHAICRYGIEDLLPAEVHLIHGPGCPVCVLPSGRLQAAIDLVERERVILCSYGDLLRVPGAQGDTLLKTKARGADVRMCGWCTRSAMRWRSPAPSPTITSCSSPSASRAGVP